MHNTRARETRGITENRLGISGRSFYLFKPAVPCFRPPLPSNAVLEALCALTGAMRHDDDDDNERRSWQR